MGRLVAADNSVPDPAAIGHGITSINDNVQKRCFSLMGIGSNARQTQCKLRIDDDSRLASVAGRCLSAMATCLREIQPGIGPATVRIPKAPAKSEESVTFHSALAPYYTGAA